MKVAICISGQPRSIIETYELLNQNLFSHYDCDIFMSLYQDKKLNYSNVIDLYKPKIIEIEEQDMIFNKKYQSQTEHNRDTKGLCSMFYKVKKCNDLKSQYENVNDFKYDIVFRLRSDIYLKTKIELPKIEEINNNVYFPAHSCFFGINDQVGFSSSKNMDLYSELYNQLETYYNRGILFNPEILLREHLLENKMNLVKYMIEYYIRRENGIMIDGRAYEQNVMANHNHANYVKSLILRFKK